jgi:hypothetical protein
MEGDRGLQEEGDLEEKYEGNIAQSPIAERKEAES